MCYILEFNASSLILHNYNEIMTTENTRFNTNGDLCPQPTNRRDETRRVSTMKFSSAVVRGPVLGSFQLSAVFQLAPAH